MQGSRDSGEGGDELSRATGPDDPGFLSPPDWHDNMGLDEETVWDRRNARVSLELQMMRLGYDTSRQVR